jgi:predicted NBD/HSP70 family sugar kinase
MLVGVDWGGTKIEAMAIGDDGQSITRLREMTPVGLRRLPGHHRLARQQSRR